MYNHALRGTAGIASLVLLVAACGGTPSAPSPTPSQAPTPPSASPEPSVEPSANPVPSTPPSGWQPAAPMVHPRILFHSVLLTDGTMLAVGDDGCGLAGANKGSEITEVYDPTADSWTQVGSLNKPRGGLQLMALPDGAAMVLGGVNEQDEEFSSTKIYSPIERGWSDGPLMIRAGVYAAIATADGMVISVGLGGTEILEPGAKAWRRSAVPPKVFVERMFLLADGLVLAVGSNDNEDRDAAFLTFDPDRETWKRLAAPPSYRSDVVPLDDGSVLAVGTDDTGTRVERYERAADRWVTVAPIDTGRYGAQITRLTEGRVLVAGGTVTKAGSSAEVATDTTEIYDPASDTWKPGPSLLAPRERGYAMTLADGSVLVYGGHATWSQPPSPDTGSDCPPPIAETERLYAVP
jgi:Kelch motif protein